MCVENNMCSAGLLTYSIEHAQQMAAHESARTTKLYDRRNDKVTLEDKFPVAIPL
jgi:hypothetical protein